MSVQPKPSAMSASQAAGPLVWIDCEMTGLNPRTDKILEIAVCVASFLYMQTLELCWQVLITNGDLELVDDGVQFIVHADKDTLGK